MLDELERVRAYRADVLEPDAATVAAARMQLMEAVRRESRASAPRRRVQRRRRLVLAGALSAAGVGVAGALGLTTAATPVSALAAEMNQLAKAASSQDWTGIPGPGQYIYTESVNQYDTDAVLAGGECDITKIDHRQIWIATDGSGAINETFSDPQFTSAADRQRCATAGITDPATLIKGGSGGERFPAGGLSLPTNDWQSFSTDPQTLLTQVHQHDGGPNTPAEWFTNIADFMRESDVPPVIRAALYRATALIPGVKLLGPVTTREGRSGLGVAFYADGQPTHTLIFDQTNGRMIGELYYDQSGKLADWADYTQQGIVDSVPDYPTVAGVVFPHPSGGGTSPGQTTNTTRQSTTPDNQSTTTTDQPATTTGAASTPSAAPATATSGG